MREEVERRVRMARKLLDKLLSEGFPLLSLVIFGSTARGRPRRESDIDLLVIVREKRRDMWRVLNEKAMEIEPPEGPFFSFILKTEEELRENPLILLDMTEESIVLHDPEGVFERLIEDMKGLLRRLGSRRVWIDEDTWYWDLKPDWRPGEEIEIKL